MSRKRNSERSKYERMQKSSAVRSAFLDGLKFGLLCTKGYSMDYGFGSRGLGIYFLDPSDKIVAFFLDENL